MKIDRELFERQRLALQQAIKDSPHPLRKELLEGLQNMLDSVADELDSVCCQKRAIITKNFP